MIRALPFLLYSELLLAHPGHGKPGFVHSHDLADAALVLFGLVVVGAACWGFARAWRRRA